MGRSTEQSEERERVIVGVDTGGTFTDVLLREANGSLSVRKLPSTPQDPSESVIQALLEIEREGLLAPNTEVVHGTTVATNALLQRRGVATALIITQGFRDVLEIGRQARTDLYAFQPRKPIPLLPRTQRFELRERLDWRGRILTNLDPAEVTVLLEQLRASGFQSLAVCFLFAHLNPVHEQLVGHLARERGFAVSLSSEIAPEPREYERASTTVANAFVAPLMAGYLQALETRLDALPVSRLRVMQSNGGALSASEAARYPVKTALSGPAGGVIAASRLGATLGMDNLLTFDMGGTSTDVALIVEGDCPIITHGGLGDMPLRTPMLDIHTVGAGGGSLARLDRAGSLRVGPESAGADPGPVAYGRGQQLTVTDANVFLGRLPASVRLGGRLALDADRVQQHFQAFARTLHCTPEQAAQGIVDVANAAMGRALRHVSVERGHDPARFALVSFGGAGGLHVCALAHALNIATILVPRFPGAFSAIGLAMAPVRREYVRALAPTPLTAPPQPEMQHFLVSTASELHHAAAHAMEAEDVSAQAWQAQWFLDMRYVGQSFEIRVPFSLDKQANEARPDLLISALNAFHVLHKQRFGHASVREPVETTGLRLLAQAAPPREVLRTPPSKTSRLPSGETPRPTATTPVFGTTGRQEIPLYERALFVEGQQFTGPAIVVQEDATTYLSAGWTALVAVEEHLIVRQRDNKIPSGQTF